MDNYIVSARKYRPASFDNVVGQSSLTTTLKNAIASKKLAHAYLFCGPRGVGKTTCARIFAKTINCLSPGPDGEACGKCESCRAFNEGRSLNIHELDAASNNSVDDIRLLIEQVNIPPQVGHYKVFIIDEVHMLSQAAFNAFLKTLEEPPAHVIFILATTEKHKILPTILSRCQIYDFNRMEVKDIVEHLKHVAESEGITYEKEALDVIAQKADGGMRDALSIFDQVASFSEGNITYSKVIEDLNILDYDYYFSMTDLLLKQDVAGVLLLLNEILSKGFEANHFIGGLASHFRDLLVSHDESTLPLLEVSASVRERYREQAKRCPASYIYKALRLCNHCDINYRQSRNKRLLVELTLIEVAQAADEAPGSGLGPTKILKPLFHAAPAPGAPTAPAPQKAAPQPSRQTTAAPAAAPPRQTTPATRPIISAPRKLRTVSLHAPHANDGVAGPAQQQPQPVQKTYGNKPFDQSQVSYLWLRFANELPREQTATAGRMKGMEPKLLDNGRIEVAVEDKGVIADLEEIRSQLTDFFRTHLDNGNTTFHFRLAEPSEKRHIYNRAELFSLILEKSRPVRTLVNELKLELD